MTRRDVLVQILSEVSGKPKEFVCNVVGVVPPSPAMDDQLPDGEGEELLERLRREKPGILNWLIEGRRKALIDIHGIALRN